ncbi:DUF2306 domain-containing protein [Thalassobacillus pellis]|uniref:DUF2306 domain-containing protein n=1 Tax=Thalassobacillus pellis TaxID=748008 RepID=UPI001960422C|nr:DUF2306 domain-containing protein [Thalassobacillus pellis]MBM7553956.1 putative membrane protein [Thalassobacillus pellis]
MTKRKTLIVILSLVSVMWILHTASKNFIVDPEFASFLSKKEIIISNGNLWIVMIKIHIVLAITALVTGPIGLSKSIRIKKLPLHQWNGRIYILSILLNMVPGYYVSIFANGGVLSMIGFWILNTLWLVTTINGYLWVRRKKVVQHRKWMLRSFFLTYANLTIYIIVATFHNGFNFDYGVSYIIAVWGSFTINLTLAEFVIKKSKI